MGSLGRWGVLPSSAVDLLRETGSALGEFWCVLDRRLHFHSSVQQSGILPEQKSDASLNSQLEMGIV